MKFNLLLGMETDRDLPVVLRGEFANRSGLYELVCGTAQDVCRSVRAFAASEDGSVHFSLSLAAILPETYASEKEVPIGYPVRFTSADMDEISFGDKASRLCDYFDHWVERERISSEEKARRFKELLRSPDA